MKSNLIYYYYRKADRNRQAKLKRVVTYTRKRFIMTKREFLNDVIAVIDGTSEVNVLELKEFAKAEIVKLDERNANRSSKPTKTQIENEPIKEKILEVLSTGERMVASAIAERLEISTQKASALCRQLVESKKLKVEDVKIPKKGKQKAYMVNAAANEEDTE